MFLVADMVARQRGAAGDRLDAARPVRDVAMLAALYAVGAIALVGLPPLSGFVGKIAVLQATGPDAERVWAILLVGTLLTVVVAARAASALFWRTGEAVRAGSDTARAPWPARLGALSLAGLLIALTLGAGPVFDFAGQTARQLVERRGYVDAVFGVGSMSAPVERTTPAVPPTLADAPAIGPAIVPAIAPAIAPAVIDEAAR
jgi:multicomponent K+:H+ antiporter subunit D